MLSHHFSVLLSDGEFEHTTKPRRIIDVGIQALITVLLFSRRKRPVSPLSPILPTQMPDITEAGATENYGGSFARWPASHLDHPPVNLSLTVRVFDIVNGPLLAPSMVSTYHLAIFLSLGSGDE